MCVYVCECVKDVACRSVRYYRRYVGNVGNVGMSEMSDCRMRTSDTLTLHTGLHCRNPCRTAVGLCRTVGLSDCRTCRKCRKNVGFMSESMSEMSDRGSVATQMRWRAQCAPSASLSISGNTEAFRPPHSTKRAQSLFLTPCSASPSWGEKHGCPSSLPPLPRSLSLLDAARLTARENARGGSDRAAHGASACRIARGRRRSMQLLFWGKSEIPWRKEGLFSEAAMDRIATRKEAVAGAAPRAHGLGGLAGRRLSSVRH